MVAAVGELAHRVDEYRPVGKGREPQGAWENGRERGGIVQQPPSRRPAPAGRAAEEPTAPRASGRGLSEWRY